MTGGRKRGRGKRGLSTAPWARRTTGGCVPAAAPRARQRCRAGARGLSRLTTPRRPSAPASAFGTGGVWEQSPRPWGWLPSRARLIPAWSSPRLSSSSDARGGGQSWGRRRCSAPAAAAEAAAAAQEGAALKPMPVHAGLVGSGEGGGAGAVSGSWPWLRHGPGDAPRFLFFLLQARVEYGPPPPPQRKARGGRSEAAAAAATGRSGIAAAGGGGRGRGGGREDTKTVSLVPSPAPKARAPRSRPAWAQQAWTHWRRAQS